MLRELASLELLVGGNGLFLRQDYAHPDENYLKALLITLPRVGSQPLYQPLGAAHKEDGRWVWQDAFAEVVPAGQ